MGVCVYPSLFFHFGSSKDVDLDTRSQAETARSRLRLRDVLQPGSVWPLWLLLAGGPGAVPRAFIAALIGPPAGCGANGEALGRANGRMDSFKPQKTATSQEEYFPAN